MMSVDLMKLSGLGCLNSLTSLPALRRVRRGEPVQTHSGTEEEACEGEETFLGCTTLGEDQLRKHRWKTETRERVDGKTASVGNGGNKGLSAPLGDQQLIHLCSNKINVVRWSKRFR